MCYSVSFIDATIRVPAGIHCCPRELGAIVKGAEVQLHCEVYNQSLWNLFQSEEKKTNPDSGSGQKQTRRSIRRMRCVFIFNLSIRPFQAGDNEHSIWHDMMLSCPFEPADPSRDKRTAAFSTEEMAS
jgi:hypothetical protein